MGKEGWNCPSLFACCLARDLGASKNFVLQAATRCLRQLPNNTKHARIYLSEKNTKILDNQLQENYGKDLKTISNQQNKFEERKITLIKYDEKLPQLKITRKIKQYIKKEEVIKKITIKKPPPEQTTSQLIKYDFSEIREGKFIYKGEKITELKNQLNQTLSIFEAAQKIASIYSVDYFTIYDKLEKLFPTRSLQTNQFTNLKQQIEKQINNYEVQEIEKDEYLTIIKKEGFEEEVTEQGVKIYTTKIFVDKDKLADLLREKDDYKVTTETSFHYDPYKFDSKLEVNLFEFTLETINEKPENIEHFLFIGGITAPSRTDLIFEYRDKDGRLRNYTPDFLIIKKNGKMIFVETKGKYLAEDLEIKKRYFKTYLTEQIQYIPMVSETDDLVMEDKKFIIEEIKK